MEKTSSLYLSRSNDTLPWHVCAAAVPCLAPAEEKKERGGVESGAARRNNDDKNTATVEDQHIKDDRCQTSFLRKREGRTEERTVEKQPRGTRERLAFCSSSSSAVYLLFFLFTLEQRQPLLFESSRKKRHVGGGQTLSMAGAQGLRRARGESER